MAFVSVVNLATASTVALVFGTLPAFVIFLGWVLGIEQPTARHLFAVSCPSAAWRSSRPTPSVVIAAGIVLARPRRPPLGVVD